MPKANPKDVPKSEISTSISFQDASDGRMPSKISRANRRTFKNYEQLDWFLEWCPGVNYFYYMLDDQPMLDDIRDLLNNIALLAALVFTVSGAIPAMVSIDELELADCKFGTWGEYGCYDFEKYHSYYPSKAFSNRAAVATYTVAIVLLMSIIMIFSISTLSSAEAELDDDTINVRNSKLIGGGRGLKTLGGVGNLAAAVGKWWSVMKWVTFIEMIVLVVGITFMFLALIYSIMIKYPSRYMRDRCIDYGYEIAGSLVGKVVTKNDTRYPTWTTHNYTESITGPDGVGRHCDVYVHANFNPDGSFAHHDDKGGLMFNMRAAAYNDPAVDWWGWSFIGLVPLVLATLIVSGVAAQRAQIEARNNADEDDKKKKWVKVLVDVSLEDNQDEVPMFYPKNTGRGARRWVPRQLQANEVFLLLGKANDGLMEVLTVPWDPAERGGMRFEWAWAYLYSVYELAEMFKATRRIDVQNKSSKVTIADSEIDVDALWLKTFECMHETGKLSPAEKSAAKEFVETLARKLDKNGDKKLHLPELLGPLGALDDKKNACSTDELDASSIDSASRSLFESEAPPNTVKHPRRGKCTDFFGTYTTKDEFRAAFKPGEDRNDSLYFDDGENNPKISLWEIMEREFPSVHFQTLLRLNCLERGYIKLDFVGPPVEGTSASDAFKDDFDVNEYYVGTEAAMRQTKRHDVENSVAFVANISKEDLTSKRKLGGGSRVQPLTSNDGSHV